MMAFESIDVGLFLQDYETFEKNLLPLVNRDREKEGLPALSGQDAMDLYLDLINEHKKRQ